ncbi:MAG TPA: metabolite traffic protein EboE [Vicinamibacterales bacterium]|nr:metabolite traffic protein EboE [Vicinamibacterales bacterium]
MKIGGRFDLTYCSNIHAGESWGEVRAALGAALPAIRRELGHAGPFAIGLRLSARAADELNRTAILEEFRGFLRDGGYYVPTINGFPYGAFHRERVKENVYLPDWREPARVEYSNVLAALLSTFLADAGLTDGSVSTVPGAFKREIRSEADVRLMARNIIDHVRYLAALRERTGVTVVLAIEPEPACYIETVDEAIDFFSRYLFQSSTVPIDHVRRHAGVCFDTCHMAVEFEDAQSALRRLETAGIRVPKFQISSALRVPRPAEGSPGRTALATFADATYLHQVVEQRAGQLSRFVDLPEALSTAGCTDCEWRIHFHVPVFLPAMGVLDTTQGDLIKALDVIKERDEPACLEVETYTWDVLPAQYKTVNMHTAIARELAWVRTQLTA